MNGAQVLVRSLANEGVDTIFGLPGIQIMRLFDALYDESRIRLVTVRNEQATTYMAYGYARTSGKPGVALVVPGPGVLNALAGLGTAYSASCPVLLISGQIPTRYLGTGKGLLHEIDDQLDLVRPLTKWCARVTQPGDIPRVVRRAMYMLRTGRQRPVEIEVPPDVLEKSAEVELLEPLRAKPLKPNSSLTKKAARLLSGASLPTILAGGGVISSGCSEALQTLAETINAPILTTPEAKGCVSDDHPLSLGSYFHRYGAGLLALQESDVVLAIGTRLFFYGGQRLGPRQKLIQIDVDREEIGRNFEATVGIQSDAGEALKSLISELRGKAVKSVWKADRLDEMRKISRKELEKDAPLQMRIIDTIRDTLDEDAIIVSDMTNIGYWSSASLKGLKPRTYVTPSYFGTLGYAFPTALGAKVANPDKQVIALCGDGGFMYASQELSTAIRENLGIIVLVFNDGAFGASLSDQEFNYQGRVIGTKLNDPDFVALARTFGAKGVRLSRPEELDNVLGEALRHESGPTVIEVPMPTLPTPFQLKP
jgi:acetolactate synthase-1/2/3 large subunit